MANLAERFYRYSTKVYGLNQHLRQISDGRVYPTYSLVSIFAKIMAGIITGKGSFNQIEKAIKHGTFDKVGGKVYPTGDTLTYGLRNVDQTSLMSAIDEMIK